MSAPGLWILLPGIAALVLYLLRQWERAIYIAGILITTGLAWLAWLLPVGKPITSGPWPDFLSFLSSITLSDTMTVLGRRFILEDGSRPLLILIYVCIAFWFGGAYFARTGRLFIPLGLGMAALLTAALSVDPFLYAALLIEVAVLVSTPILSPPGQPVGRGVLRYLTFQTMGMPFILFTGWLITSASAETSGRELIQQTALLMGLGFAFLMAIFPFHSWIPMLGEEAHPYAAAFIFFLLPAIVSILGLEFLSRYPWLQGEPVIRQALSLLGAVMVLIGGLWAPFQRHLGRIMGYAVIVEIGLSLLALSLEFSMRDNQPVVGPPQAPILGSSPELGIFFALFLPRALALGTWGLALATLRAKAGDLKFRSVYGLGRQLPIVASSLVLAHFSMAGFPLLAGFPTHIALWSALAEQSNALTLLALLGSAGLMGAGLRTLAILVMGNQEQAWQAQESRMQAILLSLAALMIIGLGLTPGWMLPAMNSLLRILGGG